MIVPLSVDKILPGWVNSILGIRLQKPHRPAGEHTDPTVKVLKWVEILLYRKEKNGQAREQSYWPNNWTLPCDRTGKFLITPWRKLYAKVRQGVVHKIFFDDPTCTKSRMDWHSGNDFSNTWEVQPQAEKPLSEVAGWSKQPFDEELLWTTFNTSSKFGNL